MLAEALATGVITRERVQDLRDKIQAIRQLTQYWLHAVKIFGLNILILKADEPRLHRAQSVRSRYGLLTNDSLILAAMDEYGITCLASRDQDFDHVAQLTVYKPTDFSRYQKAVLGVSGGQILDLALSGRRGQA